MGVRGQPVTRALRGLAGDDGVLGRVPQSVVDDEDCSLQHSLEAKLELRSLGRVADNAQRQYVRSRPAPSPESIKRTKELDLAALGLHPLFSESGAQGRRWAGSGAGPGLTLPSCQAHAASRRSCSAYSWWTALRSTVHGR